MHDNASVSRNVGSGVVVYSGTFTMNGNASVSGNTTTSGGGVLVEGTFNMNGNASISGNTAPYGGGVYVSGNSGNFLMNENASISGNTATHGGGVCVDNGNFILESGVIYGADVNPELANTANNSGASLYVDSGTAEDGDSNPLILGLGPLGLETTIRKP
jgi:hypothetical protein